VHIYAFLISGFFAMETASRVNVNRLGEVGVAGAGAENIRFNAGDAGISGSSSLNCSCLYFGVTLLNRPGFAQ